ncbi:MAG TPA: hypothetical protein VFE76_16170 [Myxococcales bacterium]|jgi:hypothetical protein|nr:hypothetical protein [Myxococcales bacterium]
MIPLLILAAGIVGVGTAADPAADVPVVRATIRAVAATRNEAPNDPRLSPIASSLDDFGKDFRYRGYRLVGAESFALGWRISGEMELPGRRSVTIAPLHLTPDGRVKMHLMLHGAHPEHATKMETDFSLPEGATVFVGGMRLGDATSDSGEVLLVGVTIDRIPARPPIRATDLNANGRPPPEEPALPPAAPAPRPARAK